jgi:hypothetical protein
VATRSKEVRMNVGGNGTGRWTNVPGDARCRALDLLLGR